MNFEELKKYYDTKANSLDYDFKLRIYRALSWGQAAELEDRLDEKVMKLWISFNALYGSGFNEFSDVSNFLESVIKVDKDKKLKKRLMDNPNTIKNFISIPELYDEYWKNEDDSRNERVTRVNKLIEREKEKYKEFIESQDDADKLLYDLFRLVYLLRNQMFHGSSSYASGANENSKEKCKEILELFIPDITEIMIDNPDNDWHSVKYKPLKNESITLDSKKEREMAIKVSGWLRKVESDGEYKTPPLAKESRRIVYKILEAKGIYDWKKYYPSSDTEGLIITKKKK